VDFELSSEQEELRASVRRFCEERAPLTWVRSHLDNATDPRGTSDDVWQGLADLGLAGMLVPESRGGAGGTMVDLGAALEELGRAAHPGPLLSSAVGGASMVLLAGNADDHAALLPDLASGASVVVPALLEPGRRSATEVPATVATPRGDGWTITGTKAWVLDADGADVLLVSARTGAGVGVFAVRRDAPGVAIDAAPTVDATRRLAHVTLSDAEAHPLGEPSVDASAAIVEVVDRLAAALVVDGVGAASRALELAVAYAHERKQFGVPIGSFQAVQHLCADMLRDLELGRAGGYFALWACDAADAAERHRAATMAKAFAAEAFPRIGASAIQVLGGIGFTWEHDAHLYFKRLLTVQHVLGGPTDHLAELATLIL
jgi:alkylation response protein AidB-like acyl-CoA dehydrogenase